MSRVTVHQTHAKVNVPKAWEKGGLAKAEATTLARLVKARAKPDLMLAKVKARVTNVVRFGFHHGSEVNP